MTLKRSLNSSSVNSTERFHLFNPSTQYSYKAGLATGVTNSNGVVHVTFTTPFATIPSVVLTYVGTTSHATGLSAANVTVNGFDIYNYNLEDGSKATGVTISVDWIATQPVASSYGLSAYYTSAVTTDSTGKFRVNFPIAYTSIPTVITTNRDITAGLVHDNLNRYVSSVDLNGFYVTVTGEESNTGIANAYVGQFSWIANPPASAADGISTGSVTTANPSITPGFSTVPGYGTTYASAPIICVDWGSLPEPAYSEAGAEIYVNTITTTGFTANIQTYEGSLASFTRTFNWIAAVSRNP